MNEIPERLTAALEGRYTIERELEEGDRAGRIFVWRDWLHEIRPLLEGL